MTLTASLPTGLSILFPGLYFYGFRDKAVSCCHMVTPQESSYKGGERGPRASVTGEMGIPRFTHYCPGVFCPPACHITLDSNPSCLTYFLTLPCGKGLWYLWLWLAAAWHHEEATGWTFGPTSHPKLSKVVQSTFISAGLRATAVAVLPSPLISVP